MYMYINQASAIPMQLLYRRVLLFSGLTVDPDQTARVWSGFCRAQNCFINHGITVNFIQNLLSTVFKILIKGGILSDTIRNFVLWLHNSLAVKMKKEK